MSKVKVGEYGLEEKTEGMYARTENGILGMIVNANANEMINGPEIQVNEKIYCVERNLIKNIKENIIDLIEKGDVLEVYAPNTDNILKTSIKDDFKDTLIYNAVKNGNLKIKSILTKEQYEERSFKVGE